MFKNGWRVTVAGFVSVPVRPFCLSSVPFFVDVGVDFDWIGILLPYLACFVKPNETKRNEMKELAAIRSFHPSQIRMIGLVRSHAGVLWHPLEKSNDLPRVEITRVKGSKPERQFRQFSSFSRRRRVRSFVGLLVE